MRLRARATKQKRNRRKDEQKDERVGVDLVSVAKRIETRDKDDRSTAQSKLTMAGRIEAVASGG